MKKLFLPLLFTLLLAGCAKIDVFEKIAIIPQQAWGYDFKPEFTFSIADTTSLYNVFIVLRHGDAYRYNNIWLNLGSQAPGDSMRYQNIDIQLATDANGWEGNGMDDIYEVRKNITPGPVPFKKPGVYRFTLSQIMRENPLRYVLDVGVHVEKVAH